MAVDLWADARERLSDAPLPRSDELRATIQQRRRRGYEPRRDDDGRAAVRLLRDDGLLRWVYEPPGPPRAADGGRRSWRAVGLDPRETVTRIPFREPGENAVTAGLVRLDQRLNPVLGGLADPAQGLRRWDGAQWAPLPAGWLAGLTGRVLVLVHGTFSASAMYASEFAATTEGQALFERLTHGGEYSAVLAFDHPTLSVAPWLNALALRDALAPCAAELDFVGHSRGGLVIAWLLRLAPALPVRQALFVGSPLAGTSLAAPDRLRQALDTLASIADALAAAAARAGQVLPGLQPLSMGVAGLACVLGRLLQLGARTPLADAAVGLVPGLLAQGRVSNNLELAQLWPLQGAAASGADLRAIGGSFRPSEVDEPLWKAWKRITHLKDQAAYYGADLIFDQANDLVVDSAAMNRLGDATLAAPQWEDLGVSATTHHCNYFQDGRVLNWLDGRLR